jgi:hypothetical protein
MRRSRRRNGFRRYRLELHDREIEALVLRGLLLASEQTKRNAHQDEVCVLRPRPWAFDLTCNTGRRDAKREVAFGYASNTQHVSNR